MFRKVILDIKAAIEVTSILSRAYITKELVKEMSKSSNGDDKDKDKRY